MDSIYYECISLARFFICILMGWPQINCTHSCHIKYGDGGRRSIPIAGKHDGRYLRSRTYAYCRENSAVRMECCSQNGCSLVVGAMVVGTDSCCTSKWTPTKYSFFILQLCSKSLLCTACDVKHTREPLYGYHCVSSSQGDCVLQCLTRKTCHYMNHKYGAGKYDLALERCESLKPVRGGDVNVSGPPRDACLHWEPGL